ncbi:two-component system response regulator [Pseudomonas tohonis]|uniref:two-component system response regulator n=1 Tax=Pseudomonas tohonis TaxID=2725477 RepID=UPI0022F10A7B|nr:two-component system response regulator [Pseudomonas tohonis]
MGGMLDRPDREVILVVDDTPDNLELMSELLMDRYRVKVAGSGAKALRIAAGNMRPDLILLDVMMPEMDGYEVCARLKADAATRDIPVIFLTARSEIADEQKGFDLGAVDYITKPISPPIVLARVKAQLQLKATADFLRDKSEYLELEVRRRTREIHHLHYATIEALAGLADMRDNPDGNHLLRVELYMRLLAGALARQQPGMADELTEERIALMAKSALLHDIGKVALPDRVLLNPGQLEGDDLRLMQSHTRLGREALERAESRLGGVGQSFLAYAKEIQYGHHEHWDGSGYPQGLRGDQIPLSARLMALVDCYDELTRYHPYRSRLSGDEAVMRISAGSGSEFDPLVVLAFLEVADGFARIAERHADSRSAIEGELQRLEDSIAESIELTLPE